MKNALLLFACGPADQLPGIIMSVLLLGLGIFFLYRAARGRGISFKQVLRRDRVLWTRIIGTGLLALGVLVFAVTIYRMVWPICSPPVMRTL